MSTSYNVTAKRWDHGWELHIPDEGVTQARTLASAEQAVRDYVATVHDLDEVDAEIVIIPEIGSLLDEVEESKRETIAAAVAQQAAARRARKVALGLREKGLSVSDTATILGVSRGRVSQLINS
ncbi:antitoxin HicB [Jiangella asiatica]|uniref:Antitoxin HicB n=1 Tax=Jiangella asiatica TaxID=2530372 RepID=A0A4R5DQ26_9ACTN|nr:antitoxin HicB [Jiangella asiatica]TDE14324.1 antitoxin HicB [Jiangella asiatica]